MAAIIPEQKLVEIDRGDTLPFDHLMVATGATPRLPGVSGEDLQGIFFLRNVADAIRIKSFIQERMARRAVVVGAGLISLEMCEAFRRLGLETTDVEVVLGGSVFKGKGPLLVDTVTQVVHRIAPRASIVLPEFEPVVGAVFLALESLGVEVSKAVHANVRASLPEELRRNVNVNDQFFST